MDRVDKERLSELLVLTEAHVALGERHIARQHEIIAELERDGHDTSQAESLLVIFEQSQRLHVEDRDRVRKELDNAHRP